MIIVYRPGATVELTNGLPAVILSVHIHHEQAVEYTVVWWDDKERCQDTVQSFEIAEGDDQERVRLVG